MSELSFRVVDNPAGRLSLGENSPHVRATLDWDRIGRTGVAVAVAGQAVSHYRIVRKLGAGGMGVVYEAEDLRLQRHVALKFLPEGPATGARNLERFQREARVASALNHPNICTVYDVGQHDGEFFIVMELLEGQTLRSRIANQRLELNELLDLAIQITDGLAAAHAKRVIHRDLKPENIFITNGSQAKILDFGLAKLDERASSDAALADRSTITVVSLTHPGAAIGTVGYMSPEQALGRKLDARTDLFSLGAVLYEMITGQRAFPGETAPAIFDAILHQEPVPLSRLNRECAPGLEQIVIKALAKDREIRYQSAAELRVDLRRVRQGSGGEIQIIPPPSRKRSGSPARLVAAAVLTLAVAVAAVVWLMQHPAPVAPGEWVALTHFSDSAVQPTISRDGRLLAFLRPGNAFMGPGDIYVKVLPDGEPVAITHDNTIKLAPAFSPDGSLISYGTCCGSWDTWAVPVFGGTPRRLLANASGLSWIDSDHLLFSEVKQGVHMGLVTTTKERTKLRDVYLPPHERAMIHFSALSPDGRWILMVEMGGDSGWLPCQLMRFDGSSVPRPVGPTGPCISATWSPDGRWMYFTAEIGDHTHIWRQRFPDGAPEQVTSGPNHESGVAFAPDGKYFVTSVGSEDSTVWLHDGSGERQISSEAEAFNPQFAPDGSKVYYLVHRTGEKGATLNELWASDPQGHAQSVLPGISVEPGFVSPGYTISPDGLRIVYAHASTQLDGKHHVRLWTARSDNRASPQEISSDAEETDPVFTTDGTIYFQATEGGKNYVYRMRGDGSGRERALPVSVIDLSTISRDGEWAAVAVPGTREDASAISMLYPLRTQGTPVTICSFCIAMWSWDGKTMYIFPPHRKQGIVGYELSTAAILAQASKSPEGIDVEHVPGAKPLRDLDTLAPSPDALTYAFSRSTSRSNLYRIPVR